MGFSICPPAYFGQKGGRRTESHSECLTQGRPHGALPEIELERSDWVRAFLHPTVYYALGREKESDAALSD